MGVSENWGRGGGGGGAKVKGVSLHLRSRRPFKASCDFSKTCSRYATTNIEKHMRNHKHLLFKSVLPRTHFDVTVPL